MRSLAALKEKVQEDYKSKFNFDKYEIEDSDREIIVRNEATIFRNYRIAADSMHKVCRAIYENQIKFKKAEGSFMEWYTGIGFTKDKISELLKRNELYMNLEDKKEWVASLSVLAVKMLTHKTVDINVVLDAAELGLTDTSEIKIFLDARKNSDNVIDIIEVEKPKNTLLQAKNKCINYNNFEKLKKNITTMSNEEITQADKELEILEKYLKELRKNISDRSKDFENKNNLKLVSE